MCIDKEKVDSIKEKIKKDIDKSKMVIEDEPQSSGDPDRIFDEDTDDKENNNGKSKQ